MENRLRGLRDWKERRLIRKSDLVDIREGWRHAPELPLAYKTRGNIIDWRSLVEWRKDLNDYVKSSDMPTPLRQQYPRPLSRSQATKEYHRLRHLSREAAQAGMDKIANDIVQNFDPKNTLIYLEDGSMRLFYKMIANKLGEYGTMGIVMKGRNEGPFMKNRGSFEGGSPHDAKTWLYIDDWILTGKKVTLSGEYPDKFFSYHLVTSDRGKFLFDEYDLRGKTVYKIIGDNGPESEFGRYPVYGFHKIPDVLPDVFAGRTFSSWTIFRPVNGVVGRKARLFKY